MIEAVLSFVLQLIFQFVAEVLGQLLGGVLDLGVDWLNRHRWIRLLITAVVAAGGGAAWQLMVQGDRPPLLATSIVAAQAVVTVGALRWGPSSVRRRSDLVVDLVLLGGALLLGRWGAWSMLH